MHEHSHWTSRWGQATLSQLRARCRGLSRTAHGFASLYPKPDIVASSGRSKAEYGLKSLNGQGQTGTGWPRSNWNTYFSSAATADDLA